MKKLVALGDSITWGFPYGEQYSWLNAIDAAYADLECINQGINGDTLEGMLNRLNRDVFAYKPNYCIISGGINDAFSGYSIPEIENNLLKIIERLIKHSIKPILGVPINILPCFGNIEKKVENIHNIYLKTAQKQNYLLLDFRGLKEDDFSDEVHPNKKGYKKMGDRALKFFKSFYK